MTLALTKHPDGNITISFKNGTAYEEFSYSQMIIRLYADRQIDEPEMIGDFTDDERYSINELIKEMRSAVMDALLDNPE